MTSPVERLYRLDPWGLRAILGVTAARDWQYRSSIGVCIYLFCITKSVWIGATVYIWLHKATCSCLKGVKNPPKLPVLHLSGCCFLLTISGQASIARVDLVCIVSRWVHRGTTPKIRAWWPTTVGTLSLCTGHRWAHRYPAPEVASTDFLSVNRSSFFE
jgi:hypothetical protein